MKELYKTKKEMQNKEITDKPIKRITDAEEDKTLCRSCNNIYCVCKKYLLK